MGDEVVRLVVDLDARRLAQAQQTMEREWGATVGRMDGQTRRLEQSTGGIGVAGQRAAQIGQRAMQGMSAAIGAATAAGAANERQWLSLGTVILGSFAAGGPVAGAISLLGAGIGMIVGETKKADAALLGSAVAAGRWAVALGQAKHAGLAALSELAAKREELLRDGGLLAQTVLEVVPSIADSMEARLPFLGQLRGILGGGSGSLDELKNLRRELVPQILDLAQASAKEALEFGKAESAATKFADAIEVLNAAMKALGGELTPAQADNLAAARDAMQGARLRAERLQGYDRADELTGLENQNAALAAGLAPGFDRSNELAVMVQIAAQQEKIRRLSLERGQQDEGELRHQQAVLEKLEQRLGLTRQYNDLQIGSINRGLAREVELLNARNEQERELIRLRNRSQDALDSGAAQSQVDALREATLRSIARRPWEELLTSAEDTLGTGLSDLIYDGIVNGFENASDIAETIWQTLLRSLINQFVQSGIQGLLSGLGGSGGGGFLGVFTQLFSGGGGGAVGGGGGGGAILAASGLGGGGGGGGGLDIGDVLGGVGCDEYG